MATPALDLSHLPPTFLLDTHLTPAAHASHLAQLRAARCPTAATPAEATLFLADTNTAKRAEFELRRAGLQLAPDASARGARRIQVVKLRWLAASLDAGRALDPADFAAHTTYALPELSASRGKALDESPGSSTPGSDADADADARQRRADILKRAREDAAELPRSPPRAFKRGRGARPRWRAEEPRAERTGHGAGADEERRGIDEMLAISKRHPAPKLQRRSTSSFAEEQEAQRRLHTLPAWIRDRTKSSVHRPTPLTCPNADFVAQLNVIREARVYASDEVGVRAYSSGIAAVRAYPLRLSSGAEVSLLPGCDGKLAALFHEFHRTGRIAAVEELLASPTFRALRLFNGVWGVGPDTARKFYYDLGFRTLDDVVEFHWTHLTRVQQIGVKYHGEFQERIPRAECEAIAADISDHARAVFPRTESIQVGGYRRGKPGCQDVDVLLSSRDPAFPPQDFLYDLLRRLEDAGRITHTLQFTAPGGTAPRHIKGFDNLEKALVVWLGGEGGLHRRVDIIIAPAVCAGPALIGWTGGTTWERDLRMWAETKGWKFSSEGVWEAGKRVEGTEGWREGESWEDVERRVLGVLDVEWRSPTERCTE